METEPHFIKDLTPENLNDPFLIQSLLRFYNQVSLRGHNEEPRSPEVFKRNALLTLNNLKGKIVFAIDSQSEICGYVAGYQVFDFCKESYGLEDDVPEGTYYYVYGLGHSSGEIPVLLQMIRTLLSEIEPDYILGLVDHEAAIYKKKFYPLRGWTEVKANTEFAKGSSYFYIKADKVIKGGDKNE